MTQGPVTGAARSGAGDRMLALLERLYPICRSITGEGLRQTLAILQEELPLEITEIPTGTRVLDWEIPNEWNIRDAYVADSEGRRLVDFRAHNLHVVNYSAPVREKMRFEDLRPRLHTLPEHPDWIPYRTSYYDADWGFCLSERQLEQFRPGEEYEVVIDSTLAPGSLTYGELCIPGEKDEEILISSHCCHPSLCNDNLTGIAVAAELASELRERWTRWSYRFVFAPGTIGAIAWLAQNRGAVVRVQHGLVLALLGDSGRQTYKRSRRGNAFIDRAAAHVLRESGRPYDIRDFDPEGYDERQYCSPGFNLPVGRLTRSPHGEYPEYHTSADNLELIQPRRLQESLGVARAILDVVERDRLYLNRFPFGEPQLGRRGLYERFRGDDGDRLRKAVLWVLNASDGKATLLDIAERSGMPFRTIADAADLLAEKGLLEAMA
jgi:aminopeptidase-like protein